MNKSASAGTIPFITPSEVPRITNNLDKVIAILRFRKLNLKETLMLVEEVEQLRKELKEADRILAELLPVLDALDGLE